MRKTWVVLILVVFLASAFSVATTGELVKTNKNDCGCEEIVTYTRPDGSTCECTLIDGKYAVMTTMPPKSQEVLDMMATDPAPTMTMSLDDLPSSFSWLDFGGDWTTPAKNQGNCGSCWAFGALGAMEAAINLASHDPDTDIDLSEQYVLSCLGAAGGCNGGWMSEALQCIKSTSPGSTGNGINGCTIETCMPYQAVDWIPCSDKCADWDYFTDPIAIDNKLFQIDQIGVTQTNPSDPDDWLLLKNWIYDYGPIVVDIYASGGWSSFWNSHHSPTDVYEGTEQGTTNHAQVLCGWVDDDTVLNGGYWILKNSWGTGFGYNGFSNVAYGCLRVADRDVSWVTTFEWPFEDPEDPPEGPGGPGPVIEYVYADFAYRSLATGEMYLKTNEMSEFIDQSTGPVVQREWDLDGDGNIDSEVRNPKFTYDTEGEYEVTLEVWNEWGMHHTITRLVKVKNSWPPVPVVSPEYYGGDDLEINFEGRLSYDPDGYITAYHWDFGDGTTSDQSHIKHTFPQYDKVYTVTFTLTDDDGETTIKEIPVKIDKTVPPETVANIGGIDQDDKEWYAGDVYVELYATDWSGLSRLCYTVDGVEKAPVYIYGDLEFTKQITIRGQGVHTIEFYSVDVRGNEETPKTATLKIDETNPTVSYEIQGEIENGVYIPPVTITLDASDADSGISLVKYRVDSSAWEDYSGSFTISQGGSHMVYLLIEDIAGNRKEETLTLNLGYGPEKPTITGPRSGEKDVDYDFYVTSSELTGEKIKYCVDWDDNSDYEWSELVDSGTTKMFTHRWTEAAVFNVRAKARDESGAESEWSTFKINLPKAKTYQFKLFEKLPFLQKFLALPMIERMLQKML